MNRVLTLGVALLVFVGCKRQFDHTSVSISGTQCITCHQDDYEGAKDPVHVDVYPTTCEGCHNTRAWKPTESGGNSHPVERFPLSGGHGNVECATCHVNGYGPGDTPNECVACHTDDKSVADELVQNHDSFPTTCQSCHTILGWKPANDGHPQDRFPLMGGHQGVPCATCHTEGYGPGDTPNECVACHADDKAAGDQKVGGHTEFGPQCTTCHSIFAWSPAEDGHPRDRFPLRGQHAMAACLDCHVNGFGSGDTSSECLACHAMDKARADMSVASHATFGGECTACHADLGWVPANTMAHPVDRFPLNGTHGLIECVDCHTVGFGPGDTPNQCSACHVADKMFADANIGGHRGFADECTACHSDLGWKPATAHPENRFPLRGAHATVDCATCHVNGYAPGATSAMCVSCHSDNLTAANMSVSGHSSFGTDCASCHENGTAWQPAARGNHPQDRFPLRNRHSQIECTSCHTVGFGPGDTPNECVACHKADQTRANGSVSGHSGFGTNCESCHTDGGWVPAQGHPANRFPISGRHNYPCADCHNPSLGSSAGGQNTDCIGCHTGDHTRSRMADTHSDVGRYNDDGTQNFCLDCHPDGSN